MKKQKEVFDKIKKEIHSKHRNDVWNWTDGTRIKDMNATYLRNALRFAENLDNGSVPLNTLITLRLELELRLKK